MNTLGNVEGWNGGQWEIYDSPCESGRNRNCFVPIAGGARHGRVSAAVSVSQFCLGSCDEFPGFGHSTEDVTVHIRSEHFAHEIQWRIDDASFMPASALGGYENHYDYYTTVSVNPGLHTFAFFDTFGDGWHGGYYELLDEDTSVILGGSIDGLVEQSGGQASFCVGTNANCSMHHRPVHINITVQTRDHAHQIQWQVDRSPVYGYDEAYDDNSTYSVYLVVQEGQHTLYCFDAYGDGWDGGFWEVRDRCSNLIAGGVNDGQVNFAGSEILFTVPYTDSCQGDDAPSESREIPVSTLSCGQSVSGDADSNAFGVVGSEHIFEFDASANYNYRHGVYHFSVCGIGTGSLLSVYDRDLQTRKVACYDCFEPETGCHFVDALLPDGPYSLVVLFGSTVHGSYQVHMTCFNGLANPDFDLYCGDSASVDNSQTVDQLFSFEMWEPGPLHVDACGATSSNPALRLVSDTMEVVVQSDAAGMLCHIDANIDDGFYVLIAESTNESYGISFNCDVSG
eukprot:SAG31_NODE_1858_length_7061_cov_60.221201_9_plen_510_part_00